MIIDQTILDRTLQTLQGKKALLACQILQDNGYEAYFVGGSVRDMLLSTIPKDVDIATSAKPHIVKEFFPKHSDIAEHLGSILISLGGQELEVTTFRKDSTDSNGRHPEQVTFCDKFEDAKRRDFTVNAIYFDPISQEIFDPEQGIDDLKVRLIRFIGNPTDRIMQDSLRMLRAVRFRALLDAQYHPETFESLHSLSRKIENLSGSRHFQELEKILLGPNPKRALEDLWETDILEFMIPELYKCKGIPQPSQYHKEGDVWDHLLSCCDSFIDDHGIDVRIAALFHDVAKYETFSVDTRIRYNDHASKSADIAEKTLKKFSCSQKRIEKISWLIAHHMMMGNFFEMSDTRKSHWYFHPWFLELLQLFWLDVSGTTPSNFELYDQIIKDYNSFVDSHPKPPKPYLSGNDVMELLGISPGERVGEVLHMLYERQIESTINSKAEAIEFIESLKK